MFRQVLWVVVAGISLLFASGCGKPQPTPPPGPVYDPAATIKDIMDSMVDPVADVIWESVATIVTPTGTEERRPKTDDDWRQIRRAAITLIEATNLLRMPGRRVARPGEKSEFPDIELEPEQIQELIDKDRETWNRLAQALHDEASKALQAIETKDADALFGSGDQIDGACENCHLKYWYPNQVIPVFPSSVPETPAATPPTPTP